MQIKQITKNNIKTAVIESSDCLITDVQSALDLMMSVKYETDCANIVINKEALSEDFFILSTCLAGEVLQKFINYGIRLAICGDFSKYTSKPLKDFIYECNNGKDFYFLPSIEDGINKICAVN